MPVLRSWNLSYRCYSVASKQVAILFRLWVYRLLLSPNQCLSVLVYGHGHSWNNRCGCPKVNPIENLHFIAQCSDKLCVRCRAGVTHVVGILYWSQTEGREGIARPSRCVFIFTSLLSSYFFLSSLSLPLDLKGSRYFQWLMDGGVALYGYKQIECSFRIEHIH